MIFLFICTSLLLLATVLPLSSSKRAWVRNCEFPREHIFIAASLLLVSSLLLLDNLMQFIILDGLLIGIMLYQASWLYPYLKYMPVTVSSVEYNPQADITFLASNVQMTNTEHKELSTLIQREKPDVLFLMETDQRWFDVLQPVLSGYKTIAKELKDNFYGCVFATNLTVRDVNVHYIAGDNTPSIHATLEDKLGQVFIFRGVHPRPPLSGTTSYKRDKELAQTARFARESNVPEVIMGDFNDVVWSRTSMKFMKIGEYLNPQVGRGCIKSFHAKYRWLRFPIDQFFVTKGVQLAAMYRGPHIGSDHFPIIAKIRFTK